VNTYQLFFPVPFKNLRVDKSDLLKVLEKSFTGEEWAYLKTHPAFIDQLRAEDWTREPLEGSIEWGILLLKQKQELHLAKPLLVSNQDPAAGTSTVTASHLDDVTQDVGKHF